MSELSDEQINKSIHEMLGLCVHKDVSIDEKLPPYKKCESCGVRLDYIPASNLVIRVFPNYANDLNEAAKIMLWWETSNPLRVGAMLISDYDTDAQAAGFTAQFAIYDGEDAEFFEASDANPAKAICLVALKLNQDKG